MDQIFNGLDQPYFLCIYHDQCFIDLKMFLEFLLLPAGSFEHEQTCTNLGHFNPGFEGHFGTRVFFCKPDQFLNRNTNMNLLFCFFFLDQNEWNNQQQTVKFSPLTGANLFIKMPEIFFFFNCILVFCRLNIGQKIRFAQWYLCFYSNFKGLQLDKIFFLVLTGLVVLFKDYKKYPGN